MVRPGALLFANVVNMHDAEQFARLVLSFIVRRQLALPSQRRSE